VNTALQEAALDSRWSGALAATRDPWSVVTSSEIPMTRLSISR